jgi:hypothetical protein
MKQHLFIKIVEYRNPELQFFHPHVATCEDQSIDPNLIAAAVAANWCPGLATSPETEYQWTDGEVRVEVGQCRVITKDHFEILSQYIGEVIPTTVGLDRVRQFIPLNDD